MANNTDIKLEPIDNDDVSASSCVYTKDSSKLYCPIEPMHNIKVEPEDKSDHQDNTLLNDNNPWVGFHFMTVTTEPCKVNQLHNVKRKPEQKSQNDGNSFVHKNDNEKKVSCSEIKIKEMNVKDEGSTNEENVSSISDTNHDEKDDNQDSLKKVVLSKEPIPGTEHYRLCNESIVDCKSSSKLIGHTEPVQTDINKKPYVCDVCNKSFSLSTNLLKHKRTHTGIKPYVCDVCNKAFNRSNNLTKHKLIHTGDKPFVCDLCNKSFNQNVGLRNHIRTHTGEKPYDCDVCYKSFSRSSNLTRHKRTHTRKKLCL